jgi:hypothetical protein
MPLVDAGRDMAGEVRDSAQHNGGESRPSGATRSRRTAAST